MRVLFWRSWAGQNLEPGRCGDWEAGMALSWGVRTVEATIGTCCQPVCFILFLWFFLLLFLPVVSGAGPVYSRLVAREVEVRLRFRRCIWSP
jgi:hypothetical protein